MDSYVTPQAKCNADSLRRSAMWWGALAVALLTLFFFLLFWNRFLGMRSGDGEFSGGSAFLAGLLPYRDYFTAAPPLNVFKSAAVLSLFGNTLITLRAFDVFERVLLALVLYFWLHRFFKPSYAALGAVVAIITSAGDGAEPLCSYNHDTIFMAVVSGFAASFAIDKGRTTRSLALFAMISGIFAGLAIATKQTIGMGVCVVMPIVVAAVLLRLDGLRKSAIWIGAFLLGLAMAIGLLMLWLAHLDIIHVFLNMVFVKGPAAKSSHPGDFLLRIIMIMWNPRRLVVLSLILLFSVWSALRKSASTEVAEVSGNGPIFWVFAGGVASILAGILISHLSIFQPHMQYGKSLILFSELALVVLLVEYTLRCFFGSFTRRQAQFALFATVSFIVAFMLSLSFPSFEAMLIPGIGFLIAAALDGLRPRYHAFIYIAAALLLISYTRSKLDHPFGFDQFVDPSVWTAHSTSTLPQLHGLLLPQSTVDFVDGTVDIIRTHSTPRDTIFTYPELGIFYTLSARRYPTLASSHNIDVINDQFAREEAQRVLNGKPAVIIYRRESEEQLHADELLWRHGKPSGQRDIIAAVETLVKDYKLAASYDVGGGAFPVLVYVRR